MIVTIGASIIISGFEDGPNFWILGPGFAICVALLFGSIYFDLRRADKHLNRNNRGMLDDPPSVKGSGEIIEVSSTSRIQPLTYGTGANMTTNQLADAILEFLEEHPRATIEELYQVFSANMDCAVRESVAKLRLNNRIISITVYEPEKE